MGRKNAVATRYRAWWLGPLVALAMTGCQETMEVNGAGEVGIGREPFLPSPSQLPRTRQDSVLAVRGVARIVAIALADSTLRQRLHDALASSRVKEGKLQLQRFFRHRGAGLARVIEKNGGLSAGAIDGALDLLPDLELYLPVPVDRQRWQGGPKIMVAGFLESDREIRASGDRIQAWDTDGFVHSISYDSIADQPVLTLTTAESRFGQDGESPESGSSWGTLAPCTGKKCPPPPPPAPDPCLSTLTGTTLVLCLSGIPNVSQYEGLLRGSPEVSMKLFSILPDGSGMTQIGCINEDQPGDQYYNQDEDRWGGHARLATRAAIDQANAAGRKVVMQVWEDDNGSKCDFHTQSEDVRKGLYWLGLGGAGISFGWWACYATGACTVPVTWPVFLAGALVGAVTDYLLGNDDDPIGFVALPAGASTFSGSARILRVIHAGETPVQAGTVTFAVLP